MLDLNHPQTRFIFEASGFIDALMHNAQRMTLLPSAKRIDLLVECLPLVEKLRQLNREHFLDSPVRAAAIDEAQAALEQLAHLKNGTIAEDKSDGEGHCAACGTPITRFETYSGSGRFVIVCGHCDKPFMRAKAKLESAAGFGTDFI